MGAMRLRSVLTIIALVSFPFVSFFSKNFLEPAFVISRIAVPALVIFGSGLTVCLIIPGVVARLFKLDLSPVGISLALVWVSLFMFGAVHRVLAIYIGDLASISLFGAGCLLLLIASFILMRYEIFRSLIAIFALFIFSATIVQTAVAMMSGIGGDGPERLAAELVVDHKTRSFSRKEPNVYFVVVDAYGSARALKYFLDLDVSNFLERAESKGFFVASDARAPYNMTYLTLAAMFAMDYPVVEDSKPYEDRSRFYPGLLRRKVAPQAVRAFRALNYQFYVVGNKWGACGGPHVRCFKFDAPTRLAYGVRAFLYATPYLWYEKNYGSHLLEPRPEFGVDAIGNLLTHFERNGRPGDPAFFFVHQFSPHPPYLYKPDCSVRSLFKFDFDAWDRKSIPLYKDNVYCTNRKLQGLFNWLDKHDPNAIVIVTGDHGSSFTRGGGRIAERASALSLSRFPKPCQNAHSQSVNSINLMRLAYACASGQAIKLLPNRTYFGTYETMGSTAGKVQLMSDEAISVRSSDQ